MTELTVGRFEAWVVRRREVHYDAKPRHRWRYSAFEFVASLLGRDDIWDSRHQ
jgi:hypothetical protein